MNISKNKKNIQIKRNFVFDRKLTPDPIKKSQVILENKRRFTPTKNTKTEANVFKRQLFIRNQETSQISSILPILKPVNNKDFLEIINNDVLGIKSPDIKKFENFFQGFSFSFH